MIRYAKRENAFERTERVWIVDPEALVWTGADGTFARMPWPEVTAIRLTYAPTRLKTWRYKLTLKARNGASWVIDNTHFRGIGDFEDRSASFSPFVLACVERVRDRAPGAVARLGSDPVAYWAQVGFVAAMFALLAVVIVVLPTPFGGVIWVKLALIALTLPVMFSFVTKSWPKAVALRPEAFQPELP